ncbi:MAG: SagB/ThcOx family dehydrogenase [bacterium]|nr:SagB/ThcOx family dehydrogenase [candidate division KSB1 bacterium]MDH7561051.1 SagB/ThcOx family dehydrogenase [bacterium]
MDRLLVRLMASAMVGIMATVLAAEQGGTAIKLPAPQTEGGMPLMAALKARCSTRAFSSKPLPLQVLSNLLWAACGVNRPESGKRTAPTARNMQEIDVYVALAEGLYLYNAKEHVLEPVLMQDLRAATGRQAFVAEAPVNLIFVSDYDKMGNIPTEAKDFYSATDTGYISQNVYLFCASEGLATVVRNMVDKPALAEKMGLRPTQKVILAQTVGYPKE